MRSKISRLKRELTDDSDVVESNNSPAKRRKIDDSVKSEERNQSSLPFKKRLSSVFEKENKTLNGVSSPSKRKIPTKTLKDLNHYVDDTDEDDNDDSDTDEIFIALKKGGIKVDNSKPKTPKSSPDVKPSKKKPELEKSPDSLILNHKRTPKKIVLDDFESPSPRKVFKEDAETPKKKKEESSKKKEVEKSFLRSGSPRKTHKERSRSPAVEKEKTPKKTPKTKERKECDRSPIVIKIKKTPKVNCEESELRTPRSTRRSTNNLSLQSPVSSKVSSSRRSSRLLRSETPEPEEKKSSKKSSCSRRKYADDTPSKYEVVTPKRCITPEPEEKKKSSKRSSSVKKKEKIQAVTPSTRRIVETPRTPLEKARQSLHVSTIPDALPCREKEFKNVLMFLENKLQDGIGGCMYISGVPGTGKTATVTQVIRHLQDLSKEGTMPEFKFIEINGMRLADPRQAYVQICQKLFDNKEKLAPDKAHQKLNAWFSKSDRKNNKISTVLLVDELDLICTKKQEVIYNILDWPTLPHSRLIVLTIANTMDMPERLFKGRVTSRLGLTRLTFMPYTHKQLEEIVLARLTGLNAFSHDAVQLVTRKVAAVSGDARRALDICRRATELPAPDETVKIKHIDKAIKEMTNSNIARVIRSCSEMEKLFLKSMSDVSVHSGLEEVEFLKVADQFFASCTLDGLKKPPFSSLISLSNRLKCSRLIYTNQSSGGILQKLTLNVTRDDIYYALNDKVNSTEF